MSALDIAHGLVDVGYLSFLRSVCAQVSKIWTENVTAVSLHCHLVMHTQKGPRKGDMLLQALCRRQTGGHTVMAVKTPITEERHPGSRISQAKVRVSHVRDWQAGWLG